MDRTRIIIYTIGAFFFYFVVILTRVKDTYWSDDRKKFWLHFVLSTAVVIVVAISMYYGYQFIWLS